VCGLKRIEDLGPVAGGQVGGRPFSEWLADHRPLPDQDAEWRQFLGRLWDEIAQLPRLHRMAYLLNFTAADGQLELFWVYGIASIRRIGATMQITEEEFSRIWPAVGWSEETQLQADECGSYEEKFAAIWQQLPLTDAMIALLIGTDRQKVINLRKAAGDRVSRRMIRAKSAPVDARAVRTRSQLNGRAPSARDSKQKPVQRINGVGGPSFTRIACGLPAETVIAGATVGS